MSDWLLDGDTAEWLWRIALRDDILIPMLGTTNPQPDWAATEAERDWYLQRTHRPVEDYVAELVPGPRDRAMADERERRKRLWDDRQEELRVKRAEQAQP
ncbi:hypothetical protein [Amycolatopsis rubida]|uniref:Uncharacterized protein n=1 Tax=Amycolatopsis rubida TaxID=112413 RepID=A0A1I5DXC0_9PSEU|nr:hypothetical protein [Amycolatopsis rubida]SFO03843.1 hypothetical protein SAMN05421854_101395 [Amycolatopsis rubida]